MKSIMTFAAVAVCGLSVLVSGCAKEEAPADKAAAGVKEAAKTVKDTKDAGKTATKDAPKPADKAEAPKAK